jgi:hypothetical protein
MSVSFSSLLPLYISSSWEVERGLLYRRTQHTTYTEHSPAGERERVDKYVDIFLHYPRAQGRDPTGARDKPSGTRRELSLAPALVWPDGSVTPAGQQTRDAQFGQLGSSGRGRRKRGQRPKKRRNVSLSLESRRGEARSGCGVWMAMCGRRVSPLGRPADALRVFTGLRHGIHSKYGNHLIPP